MQKLSLLRQIIPAFAGAMKPPLSRSKSPSRHAGLDPASRFSLDSGFRRNDKIGNVGVVLPFKIIYVVCQEKKYPYIVLNCAIIVCLEWGRWVWQRGRLTPIRAVCFQQGRSPAQFEEIRF